jgi:hypothetical protein
MRSLQVEETLVGVEVAVVVLSSITESNDVRRAVGRLPRASSKIDTQHDSLARWQFSVDNGHLATSYSLARRQLIRAITDPQAQAHSWQSLLLTQNNEEMHCYGHITNV